MFVWWLFYTLILSVLSGWYKDEPYFERLVSAAFNGVVFVLLYFGIKEIYRRLQSRGER